MTIDPKKLTIGKLVKEISKIENVEELNNILVAEGEGKGRKGAISAITERIGSLGDDEIKEGDIFDPTSHDIREIGAAIKEIEDVEILKSILDLEKSGEGRASAMVLIESRIKKFSEKNVEGDLDLKSMTIAGIANSIRAIESADELRELLTQEESGENRVAVKKQIQNKIESIEGIEMLEPIEYIAPEEKYPYLNHPTADKKHVRALKEGKYEDMWVYCETQRGELIDVSREMLGKAREMMDKYNQDYKAKE